MACYTARKQSPIQVVIEPSDDWSQCANHYTTLPPYTTSAWGTNHSNTCIYTVSRKFPLRCILGEVSYTEACSSLGFSSLSDRREQLTKHFFDQLKRPDNCLAHLMPLRRDTSLTRYLQYPRLYELPKARTAHYTKSFVPYCVTHFT